MDISKQVNLIDSKRLNKKNNEDYSKFLEISNRKTAIFRDIIIESECKLNDLAWMIDCLHSKD